jgi:hypothetical protein
MDQDGKKTARRFHKVLLKGKTSSMQSMIYNFGFAFCELLNLVVILVSQSILNSLFNNEFASYGIDVQTYRSFDTDLIKSAPERTIPLNPMCHVFPTEVSCSVSTGGIGGNDNKDNTLCLLPINVFYQYYFIILWWWWVVLTFVACLGLVYRLVQILLPQFGRIRLAGMFGSLGVHPVSLEKVAKLNLQTWQTFLLIRLVRNLKGSQVTTLFEALDKEGQVQDQNNGEEGQTLINHEEREENGIEMPTLVETA